MEALVAPLKTFHTDHGLVLPDSKKTDWTKVIITSLCEQLVCLVLCSSDSKEEDIVLPRTSLTTNSKIYPMN